MEGEELLLAGKVEFSTEVPYKLFNAGSKEQKPLIVYLHGFKQNISVFRRLVSPLLSINAYHLFVQGPYLIYDQTLEKRLEDWGRAWYLYDGDQPQFVHSLEQSSGLLQHILNTILKEIPASRVAVIGYSMGGYLGGYFGLSRYDYIDDLAVIGSRIKTEVFQYSEGSYDHLNVLAVHGNKDKSVQSSPQKQSCATLSNWGANVIFRELEATHRLSDGYLSEVKKWLFKLGYE